MKLDGYFTIEAAVYVSLFIFAIAKGMMIGVDLSKEVTNSTVMDEAYMDFEEADFIWKYSLVKKGVDFIGGDSVSEESKK